MVTYLSGFKKKAWKDMTPDERIAVSNRRKEVMNDPETRAVHATLTAHSKEVKKKTQTMGKLREYLIAKRGLVAQTSPQ